MDAPRHLLSKGPITLDVPPKGKALIFRSMQTYEELGRLFKYDLELLSQDPGLKATDILGHPMTVHLERRDGETRHFNGIVTDFALAGSSGGHALYHVTLRPWLWLLTRTANCRIFQHKSIPDILKQVFRDHGLTDFEEALTASYPPRDFVVQYRESDFNFISRLMEEEGIYYFFKQDSSKHTLVLADSYGAHEATPGCESLPYYPPDEHRADTDHVDRWETAHQVQPGAYVLTDFDFQRPQANLLAKLSVPNEHPKSDFEIFDYPGKYHLTNNGQDYVRVRLEELNAEHARADGETNARGLTIGALLTLSDHPVDEQNREYLVVSGRHEMRTHDPESGNELDDDEVYRCSFQVMESSRPFRPARITRKPVIHGPQTAIVVGKSGEEIWTDNYGRVKVKFHWDRFHKSDENSSCWVRVAQVWAGNGWGGIHVPRIGQEVIIEFLEGDPDCPIITGRVYNADNMPPYALPGNQTQSGLQSRSSKGGSASNFNEIRFEDKKGSEHIYVQAEKDRITLVKNDETKSVKHDETIEIGHDRQKTVKHDETVKVENNRTETVLKNESITIGGNRDESVAGAEAIDIGKTRTTTVVAADSLSVGGAYALDVGAACAVTVVGAHSTSVGGSRTLEVGKNESITIGGNRTESVAKDESIEIQGARALKVTKNDTVQVGKKLLIDAGDEVTIKTGEASIVMKKNGDITIKGKNITIDGSGKVNVKASGDVILKGSKVAQN